MTFVELADDLWTRGAGHTLGAKALVTVAENDARDRAAIDVDRAVFSGKYSASIHLLIGNAFELLIKAGFLLHGGQQEQLKIIGHDLVGALNAAETVGFRSNVPDLRWLLENLQEAHRMHRFRYGGQTTFSMPELYLTVPALETLTREVGEKLLLAKG